MRHLKFKRNGIYDSFNESQWHGVAPSGRPRLIRRESLIDDLKKRVRPYVINIICLATDSALEWNISARRTAAAAAAVAVQERVRHVRLITESILVPDS